MIFRSVYTMKKFYLLFVILFGITTALQAQRPYRVGTTTANFLEIGYGSAGVAMGDAQVSMVHDITGIYWNPAGMAFMKHNEARFMYQPWIADINTSFAAAGVVLPGIGTLAAGLVSINYGDMAVTSLDAQEGTGELFQAGEYAFSLSFARLITDWFAFGASAKFISSNIWHMSASALAVDLGVIVNTDFFSPTGERKDGLRIGMSISNYGTRMKYDGLDLIHPIDPQPDEHGNYADVPGQYRMNEWELPLIFRIGLAQKIYKSEQHQFTLEVDALHPNNNAESVNAGLEYAFTMPSSGSFFLRGGYKALWLPDSQYGLTLGLGFEKYLMQNVAIRMDYAYRSMPTFGNIHSYSLGFTF